MEKTVIMEKNKVALTAKSNLDTNAQEYHLRFARRGQEDVEIRLDSLISNVMMVI